MNWNGSYASSFEKDLLSLRPEIRFDWTSSEVRPYDDQTRKSQLTAAMDAIWRF